MVHLLFGVATMSLATESEFPMFSTDALFAAVSSKLCLAALMRAKNPIASFKLACDLYEQFPAMFPEFAEILAEDILDPRAICWSLSEELKNVPGGWDLYSRAKKIAANVE